MLVPATAGFGYVTGDTTTEVLPGDEALFAVYVFDTADGVKVMNVDGPDDWSVKVDRERVNVSVNDDYRYVKTASGYQRAVPVTLAADVPLHAEPGTYAITHTLASVEPDTAGNGSQVTFRQRQDIEFTVDVQATDAERTDGTEDETDETSGDGSDLDASASDADQAVTDADGADIDESGEQDGNEDDDASGVTGWISTDRVTDPVVLFVLFQIMWGIVLGYVLKRRGYPGR